MVAQFPSGQNTFVLDHEASGKLRVDFSRNPNRFAVNRYAQVVPCKKTAGYYLRMTLEEAGRIINGDLAEFAWPDGADAPEDVDGTESFDFLPFRCERVKYGFRLGDLAAEQADWDINDNHMAIKAQQAMTGRTVKVVTAMTTSGNYDSTHVSDVASISGNTGKWSASTTARQDIKRSLNTAANLIMKDTLGAIDQPHEMLKLVINPTLAQAMSQCQEVVDHIKGSPDALAQVRGELPGKNAIFGLPNRLYGFEIEVENAVRVTSRKGATKASSYVLSDSKAVMVSRVGGLVGNYGGPSFSTVTVFVYEKDDMTVERLHDVNDRLTRGRVVDNFQAVVTAPVSGFLFNECL